MPFYDEQGNIIKGQEQQQGTFYDEKGNILGGPEPPSESSFLRRIPDIGVTAVKGLIGLPESFVGIADIPTGGMVGKGLEEIGFKPKQWKESLDPLYSPQQQEANRQVQEAEGFFPTIGAALRNPSTIFHTALESAPSMIGGAGIARGAMKVIPKLAPLVAGALGEAAISAGQTAEQARQESPTGLLDAGQAAIAGGSGALTGVFGVLGGKLAQRLGIADIDTLMAGGGIGTLVGKETQTAKKGVIRKVLESAISEGAFEELPQSAQEQAAQNLIAGKPVGEGVANAAATGMLAGALMGGAGGVGGQVITNRLRSALQDPDADPQLRLRAAASVDRHIRDNLGDEELAEMWTKYSLHKISPQMFGLDDKPQAIDTMMTLDKNSLTIQELEDELVKDLGQEEEFKTVPPPEETPMQQPPAQPQVMPEEAAAPIIETPPTEPPVEPTPVERERPSPAQVGRIVVWNEPNNIQGKGRIIEIIPDRGLARVRYSEGYGGAQRETLREINDLRPMNTAETAPERAVRQLEQFRRAQAARAQATPTQVQTPVEPTPTEPTPVTPTQPTAPAITGTPINPSQFMEHIQAAENDDDRIDRAGKIAMQYPDARSFAEDLQTAGVSNRQFQSIMGATPQEFHDYYRETEATKAEQYRAEWTEQRAREEGFEPEETMPREALEKEKPRQYTKEEFKEYVKQTHNDRLRRMEEVRQQIGPQGGKIVTDKFTYVISKNLDPNDKEYPWRVTTFDDKGPMGHTVHKALDGTGEEYGYQTSAVEEVADRLPMIEPDMSAFRKGETLPRGPLKGQGELMPDAQKKSLEAKAIVQGFPAKLLTKDMKHAADNGNWNVFWKLFDDLTPEHQAAILKEEVQPKEAGEKSIADVEQETRREEQDAAKNAKQLTYEFGKPIVELLEREIHPNPYMIIGIAKEKYKSAEQFEAEWNPKVIDDIIKNSPWATFYGHSREPLPITQAHEVIRRILQKYNTTIEEVKKVETGEKKREDVIPDHRAYEVIRRHLVALDALLAANYALGKDIDYKAFWNDVQAGKLFDPEGPISDATLNKYFQEAKERKPSTPKAGNVVTTEDFIRMMRAEKAGINYDKPQYVPVKEDVSDAERYSQGSLFQQGDLFKGTESIQGKLFEPVKTMSDLVKKIAERSSDKNVEGNPFRGGKQVATTTSVRPELVGIVQDWLNSFGLKTKVFIGAVSDVLNDRDSRGDVERRYGINGYKNDAIFRTAQDIKKNNYIAGVNRSKIAADGRALLLSDSFMRDWEKMSPRAYEDLAHEFGHILKMELFEGADKKTRDAITDAWWAWHSKLLKGGTFGDYAEGTLTPFSARRLGVTEENKNVPITEAKNWKERASFDEWLSDQVSRWFVTNEKPQGIVDKFFAKVANAIRKLWRQVDQRLFRPAQPVEQWLDSMWRYDESKSMEYNALNEMPLFRNDNDVWQGVRAEEPKVKEGDLISKADNFNSLHSAYQSEVDKGNAPPISPVFDPVEWHETHARESIEFADDNVRKDVQASEKMLDKEAQYKARFDKGFWKTLKRLIANYGIMSSKDMSTIEFMLANPFMLGQRYTDIKAAMAIETHRDESRREIIHDYIEASNTFLRLKGDTLKKVENALIKGDRNLRDLIASLKTGSDNDKTLAAEIEALNGYTDDMLVKEFGLNAEGIAAYRQVRSTLDSVHKRWMNQIKQAQLDKYRNEKWYGLLAALHGEDLEDNDLLGIAERLGPLYERWHKALKAAATPMQLLLRTPEDVEKLGIKAHEILAQMQRDIDAGRNMTEAAARRIIEKAHDRIVKVVNLNRPEFTEAQKDKLVNSYMKQYEKTKDEIDKLRESFREVFGMGEGISDEEINKELRGLIEAYGKTRPQMQELKRIRNELGSWVAYFPRKRDDTKLHYIAVKQNVRDAEGKVIGDKTLYLNYFDIGAIGGKKLKEEVAKLTKEMGWTDLKEIEIDRTSKESEATFFKVSDMNTQRIIDNAIQSAYHKGELTERESTDARSVILHAIADELNGRAFGKHRLHRALDLVLGYKEEGLQNVLLEYIRGYAGLETKQIASTQYTDLLRDIGDNKEKINIKDYIRKYAENSLRNQEKMDRIIGTMKGVLFGYYLGANLKSVFVQLTQNLVTGAPIFAQIIRERRKGMGSKPSFLEAERRLATAAKDIISGNLSKTDKDFLHDALVKGVTMDQYVQEATGRLGNSFGGWFDRIIRIMSYIFSSAEMYNRKVAGLAMFRFLDEMKVDTTGLSNSKAGELTKDFIGRTHYYMGKANLPAPMMGGEGTAQILRGLYTFRTFTHNYILSMLPGRAGGFGGYGGDARTALHSFAYLVLLGGLLSLPWIKDLFDWWEKKTGDDVLGGVKKQLRKYGGKTLERFGMTGLTGLALGDISGSLGIGIPFVGEPSDSIYGVWAGMARKGAYGAEAFSKGDWYRGVENISPEVMANLMRGMRMSEYGKDIIGTPGYATTRGGRPIFDENGRPMSMSPLDTFRKMIGFNPTEYAERMETQRTMKNIENVFTNNRKEIYEEYKIAKSKNDPKALANLTKEIKAFNEERIKKGAENIVAPIKLSNVLKAAKATPTKKERRESQWKLQQTTE